MGCFPPLKRQSDSDLLWESAFRRDALPVMCRSNIRISMTVLPFAQEFLLPPRDLLPSGGAPFSGFHQTELPGGQGPGHRAGAHARFGKHVLFER